MKLHAVSNEIVLDHHSVIEEAMLCRNCRNLVREEFYGILKTLGFPRTQPLTIFDPVETSLFGPLLLAALGRGLLYDRGSGSVFIGDEVELVPGWGSHPACPLVLVAGSDYDLGEMFKSLSPEWNSLIIGGIYWHQKLPM